MSSLPLVCFFPGALAPQLDRSSGEVQGEPLVSNILQALLSFNVEMQVRSMLPVNSHIC